MNGRKDRGNGKDRHVLPTSSEQHAQHDSAKKSLFNKWNSYGRDNHLAKTSPGKGVSKCIDVKRDEYSSAKEQGNDRYNSARAKIAGPSRIRRKAQVSHASDAAYSQQRPEQKNDCNQKSAMEECFEIVFCQKRKYAMRCKRLSGPKKNWRKDRPDDNRRQE